MNKFFKIGCLFLIILFFIALAFVAGLGVGAITGAAEEVSAPKLHKTVIGGSGDDEIAFASLTGIILQSPSENPLIFSQGAVTPDQVERLLSLAIADTQIKAVVLHVNSPGGSAVASDEIYQQIRSASKIKPIVVLLGDTAASGGYFIAAAGSYIIANPATLTGSIGVIAEITDVQELLDKIGVQQEVYKSGEFKDLFSGTRDRTLREQAMIQELLDTSYNLFLQRVAAGRNMEVTRVRQLAEGQVYSGLRAQELGLIDAVGYRQDAFAKAQELAGISEATFVNISTKSRFELLFSELKSANPLAAFLPQLLWGRSGIQYLYR